MGNKKTVITEKTVITVKELKQLLAKIEDEAECFVYNPNTRESFDLEQIQVIEDENGNTEVVLTCFETE